ncbi:MAG: twin-arginine translocase TatA/TatE family subunit [Acidimicrobiales bacterium]
MPNIGPTELIIVLIVVLLLFGSTRLPKLARSMGEASKEFKKGVSERDKELPEAAAAAKAEEQVTMSRTELDALLAREREAQARKDAPPSV